MSPTHLSEDLTDDAVERALRADAEQWQASHPAPSLDDAVRRLVAKDGAPARRRAGWWRPVAVAAAVLLLIGGVVGVAVRHRDADVQFQPSPAVSSNGVSDTAVPTLTALPPGFVQVSGHVPSPVDAAQGPAPVPGHPRPVVLRSWVGSRTIPMSPASPINESFILSSLGAEVEVHKTHVVQGGPAEVHEEVWPSWNADDATVITVLWNAGGQALQLVYSGPGPHNGPTRAFSVAQVLAVAGSYQTRPSPSPSPVTVLPMAFQRGSTSLLLTQPRALTARRAPGGGLQVQMGAGPGVDPTRASYCSPYEEAYLTGADAGSVTVTVGSYVPSWRDPKAPCVAVAYPTRWVSVALDGHLGSRTVIDGSTGKPVALSGS